MQIIFGRKRPLHLKESSAWQNDARFQELREAFHNTPRPSEERERARKELNDYWESKVRTLPNWKEIEEERQIAAECRAAGISWEEWEDRKRRALWEKTEKEFPKVLESYRELTEEIRQQARDMRRLAAEIRGETNSRSAEPAAEKASTPQSPTSSPS